MKANPAPDGDRLVRAGNLIAIALLLGCAGGAWTLQDSSWWWPAPTPRRWLAAAALLAAYVGLCAWAWRRWRDTAGKAAPAAADNGLIVAYASQTGFAEDLAMATAQALDAAGLPTRPLPLADLDITRLRSTRRLLVIASTTGEGDPPDLALRFVDTVMAADLDLSGLEYAVLALGDRNYTDYCAFGRQLDAWLRTRGAQAMFERIEVDNGEPGALRYWQNHLGALAGDTLEPSLWTMAGDRDWRLAERRLLNPGSAGAPVYHIALQAPAGQTIDWQAGDIAQIQPCHPPAIIAAFLRNARLDGDMPIDAGDGTARPLAQWLAASYLPAADALTDLARLPQQLQPLPRREYSIASLPHEGQVHLLLRRILRPDGQPGLGSGWLCDHAVPGAAIRMRIRRNTAFHPPPFDRPLILIGNGTGIAGLRAHLLARIVAGIGDTWLLFGERNRAYDDFYGEQLRQWHANGQLDAYDHAFSRDPDGPRYVQDALRQRQRRLRDWAARGAAILVCGSRDGMAAGVDAVLRETLGNPEVDAMRRDGRYRRDLY